MAHLPSFRKTFKLDQRAGLRDIAVAVESIYKANDISIDYLGNIDPQENSAGFRIHSLLNLLGRIFEHSQAMLVAASTGSPSSAEALARIVVEGSMNVIYLALKGNSVTLVRFFRSWLKEHDRKLSSWKSQIAGESYENRIGSMIEDRRLVVVGLSAYLDQVKVQCSIKESASDPEWPPKLFNRFEALGRQTDYFESYHRLSGASHLTGEDTLTWLLSLDLPAAQKKQIGTEAWAYSIMMTRIASDFYIDAVASCVLAYGRTENDDLRACRIDLAKSVADIAQKAGVPYPKTDA